MSQAPGIELSGRYTLGDRTLFEAEITLLPAQWTCLLGPSGVGKSTVLRLLLGLETGGSFTGSIKAHDGQDVATRISYMAQQDLLLPWASVTENVLIGATLRGEKPDHARAQKLLARVGLSDHAEKTPAALSGGMRQRAALARTLMEDRPVVLLDEPFSALDAGTRADMQELAAEVLKGKTVLLVTHDPGEAARLGEQILVMSATGATPWPIPTSPAIRDINAPDTLDCQAKLLDHLRKSSV